MELCTWMCSHAGNEPIWQFPLQIVFENIWHSWVWLWAWANKCSCFDSYFCLTNVGLNLRVNRGSVYCDDQKSWCLWFNFNFLRQKAKKPIAQALKSKMLFVILLGLGLDVWAHMPPFLWSDFTSSKFTCCLLFQGMHLCVNWALNHTWVLPCQVSCEMSLLFASLN